ncbi:uncharacterized protein LOC114544904 [Dendronephthya gigantea]|uniref:uncharacterized protein LOC114544904 n=1 Tax=Dendronephthya gigantea TaxID=151771 RepID=UPI00106B81A8|nr:uncharacterized protein LOC114544904 [Dendronephthya gigantea]
MAKLNSENISAHTPKKVYVSSDFIDGCRLCGNKNDRMINVFHKPGQKKKLVEVIADTLGVSICENDQMSPLICRCCERKITKFIEFKNEVHNFQDCIHSRFSVKRCIIPTEETNKKRITTNSTTTIDTPYAAKQLGLLPTCHTGGQTDCNTKSHEMVYLEIDPLSLCNNNTSTSVSGVPLNALQIEKLHRALKSRFPTHIGQCAMSIKEIKQACQEILLKELDEQCKELCLRKNPSVLRNNGFDDIVKFDWLNIVYELQKRCPFLLSVLNTVTAKKKTQSELAPCIGMAYAILMIQRNHELSLVQRINTLIMAEGNAKKQLYTRCQKVGFALSHQSKVNLLDEIGGHFADEAITMVKNGCKMQGTGDNWDFRILCHDMRKDHQNKDMHYFASNLLFERVPIPDNLSLSPKHDIKTLENSSFLLSVAESKKLLEDYIKLL